MARANDRGTAWAGSRRRTTLPPDWARIRAQVLVRDRQRCVWCEGPASDVDHIGDPGDHTLANLRALCRRCHQWRSTLQGTTAAAAARTRVPRRARPPEPHPGLTTTTTSAGKRRSTQRSTPVTYDETISDPDVVDDPETAPEPLPDGDDGSDDDGSDDGDEAS